MSRRPHQETSDLERFEDLSHVLYGPAGSTAWRQLLYILYVVAILAGLYGFTVTRAVVEVYGPRWRAAGATEPVAVGGATVVVGLLVLAHLAGRRRGPITPEPPWIDHVVSSSVDRALTLRESWLLPWLMLLAGGGLLGGVIGAGLFGGGATGPLMLPVGLVVGLVAGAALAVSWLSGQVQADPARRTGRGVWTALVETARPRTVLRGLGAEGLRTHSLRAARVGGAVRLGDARSLRLEVAAPVNRGRHRHLRPRGRTRTFLARDLLGLRRQPLLGVGGVALVVPGAVGAGWVVAGDPPVAVAVLAVLALQLGAGVVAEGLRLHADGLGAPGLFGGAVRSQALAHTLAPTLLLLLVGGPVTVATSVLLGGAAGVGAAVGGVLSTGTGVAAGLWLAAFHGPPPISAFGPAGGPSTLLAWWAWPRILSLAVVTAALLGAASLREGIVAGGVLVAALGPALLAWGATTALAQAATAHRD